MELRVIYGITLATAEAHAIKVLAQACDYVYVQILYLCHWTQGPIAFWTAQGASVGWLNVYGFHCPILISHFARA